MYLVIPYKDLGTDAVSRRRALDAVLDFVRRPVGDVWSGAAQLVLEDARKLLAQLGLVGAVKWQDGVPLIVQASDGYVVTGIDELMADIRPVLAGAPQSHSLTPKGYQTEMLRLAAAARVMLDQHLNREE